MFGELFEIFEVFEVYLKCCTLKSDVALDRFVPVRCMAQPEYMSGPCAGWGTC